MFLKNSFSLETRCHYLYNNYECWICGTNGSHCGGLELHHIFGRVSASALNSAPLCKKCHSHIGHTRYEHIDLLGKTIAFLISQGYKLQQEDHDFMEMIKNDLRGIKL